MSKFLISESEKQRILEMHQNATSRQYLTEAVKPFDPWSEIGGSTTGKGLKFKSQADWDNFSNIVNVTFTTADGPNFPNIMKKNENGQYELKVYQTSSGSLTAEPSIESMALSLFNIASANGIKGLNALSYPTSVSTYFNKQASVLNTMFSVSTGIGTPIGLTDTLNNSTKKWDLDIKKDWTNIITLKLAPIYKQRYDAYVSVPVQK